MPSKLEPSKMNIINTVEQGLTFTSLVMVLSLMASIFILLEFRYVAIHSFKYKASSKIVNLQCLAIRQTTKCVQEREPKLLVLCEPTFWGIQCLRFKIIQVESSIPDFQLKVVELGSDAN